jgi:hypothetical protein
MGTLPEFRFTDPRQARLFEWDFFIARDIEPAPPDAVRMQGGCRIRPTPPGIW